MWIVEKQLDDMFSWKSDSQNFTPANKTNRNTLTRPEGKSNGTDPADVLQVEHDKKSLRTVNELSEPWL